MYDLLGLARDILKGGRLVCFQAKGWSMHPFVQDRDFITVSPVENSSIKIGDVVFYSTAEDRIIVHRVIRKHQKDGRVTMLIKGDATSRLIVCSFPTFWDKKGMEFTLNFCAELAEKVPCYELGFIPDKSVLDFVRK